MKILTRIHLISGVLKFFSILLGVFLISCQRPTQHFHLSPENLTNNSSIIGGRPTTSILNTGKFVVGLFAPRFGSCSGVIIGENLILTAAHCIPQNPRSLTVVFDTNLNTAPQKNMRAVITAKTPPNWNPSASKNKGDIALIKFDGKLPVGYQPSYILNSSYYLQDRSFTLLAGYGIDKNNSLGNISGLLKEAFTTITNARFSKTEVLLSQLHGFGTCSGDSGGPAFILINGVYYLWGITSNGDPECRTHGIYTNIIPYLPWLRQMQLELRAAPNYSKH